MKNRKAPLTSEAIENAIEFIRSIAFHINEDDYHGKHIAHYMQQALAWLEGDSCRDDNQGKADNQPAPGNKVTEFNSGNEWTGNPDIDNAIIMLDRIDTLESCDDDRIEAVKAVLRGLAGNYPVTPDGWISCSEQMPNEEDVLVYCSDAKEQMVGFHKGKGLFQFFYMNGVEGVCEPSHWMPLPEPPQEVNRG